jgi:hypothetical protein
VGGAQCFEALLEVASTFAGGQVAQVDEQFHRLVVALWLFGGNEPLSRTPECRFAPDESVEVMGRTLSRSSYGRVLADRTLFSSCSRQDN